MRTKDEVLARLESIKDDDFFGFGREVLITYGLSFEQALDAGLLKDGATNDDESWKEPSDVRTAREASEYLEFAIGKVIDHRGISASRSVDKLMEFAWLLGRDDVVHAMIDADYAQYGAPKLRAFADGMGPDWSEQWDRLETDELQRMADGLRCGVSYDCGCGA